MTYLEAIAFSCFSCCDLLFNQIEQIHVTPRKQQEDTAFLRCPPFRYLLFCFHLIGFNQFSGSAFKDDILYSPPCCSFFISEINVATNSYVYSVAIILSNHQSQ